MNVRASLAYYLLLFICIVSNIQCSQSQISLSATEKLLRHIHGKVDTGWPIDEKVVRECVKEGATLNVRLSSDSFEKAPLIYWMLYNGCKYRDIEICLEHGMSFTSSWQKFPTPFHYAAALRKWQHSYLLINKEMANTRDEAGITPLLLVTAGCHEEAVRNKLVKRLLQVNARPNDTDDVCGVSPVWCAALFHEASTIKLLRDYGAYNISIMPQEGEKTGGLLATQLVLLPVNHLNMGDDKLLTRALRILIRHRRYVNNASFERSALTHRSLIEMPLLVRQKPTPNSTHEMGIQQ